MIRKLPISMYPLNEKVKVEEHTVIFTKKTFQCQFSLCLSSEVPKQIQKFYKKRFFLFKRYAEGIILDEESWYSVIPEDMSYHIASKIAKACGEVEVVDGFCGSGGLAIQVAGMFKKVICIDIDPIKIGNITHNLKVYGKKAEVKCMDFFDYENSDDPVLLVCPPWGGLEYCKNTYDLSLMKPSFEQLLEKALKMSSRIVMQLPKNIDLVQMVEYFKRVEKRLRLASRDMEVEEMFINDSLNQLIIYYGF